MSRRLYRRAMEGYLPDSIRLRDVKNRGSLKPIGMMHPKKTKEDSKLDLWTAIMEHKSAPFINEELVEKFIKSPRSPYVLFNWLLVCQLGLEDKLSF